MPGASCREGSLTFTARSPILKYGVPGILLGILLNSVVLRLVREALGIERKKRIVYDDLDHLAGTWSEEDAAQFEQATAVFEKVDEELWK